MNPYIYYILTLPHEMKPNLYRKDVNSKEIELLLSKGWWSGCQQRMENFKEVSHEKAASLYPNFLTAGKHSFNLK